MRNWPRNSNSDIQMYEFTVHGPYSVAVTVLPHGRQIDVGSAEQFWATQPDLADAVGCYVFGLKTGGGITPWYVGKSGTGFRHECFQSHKLQHYNETLMRHVGTPVVFLIRKESGPPGSLESCLHRVEEYLIAEALHHNPELTNIQRVEWSIRGIYHSSRGRQSGDALLLSRALGLASSDAHVANGDASDDALTAHESSQST